VQLNVGHLDANGVYNGQYTTMALSGYVRMKVRMIAIYIVVVARRCFGVGSSSPDARDVEIPSNAFGRLRVFC
jgi:hypothetical protein